MITLANWREWLIFILILILLTIAAALYHKGYASCEASNTAAANGARLKALSEANETANAYQAEATQIITEQKAKTETLQEKLNALSKQPCDNDAIGSDFDSLYNSRVTKSYNTTTPR